MAKWQDEFEYKVIYTLRIRLKLKRMGFEPILEKENTKKPGFKCWFYEATPAFKEAFDKISREESYHAKK